MAASRTFHNLPPDKQQRILDQALREFADKGYAGASINALVSGLGISKGSIFKYFGDKAGLFAEVFLYSTNETKRRLSEARDRTAGRDVFERVVEMILAGLRLQDETSRHLNVYLRIVYEEDIPHRDLLLGAFADSQRRFLTGLLAEGQERGQVAEDLDPGLAALVIMSVAERFLVARGMRFQGLGEGIYQAGQTELRTLAQGAVDILKRGMGAQRGPAPAAGQREVRLYSEPGAGPGGGESLVGEGLGRGSDTFRNLPPDKRERILDKAIDEFAHHGYGPASLNTVVRRIGISKGSIFQYFNDKAGLFQAVFNHVLGRVIAPLRRLRDQSADQDLFTRLNLNLMAGIDLVHSRPNYFNLYLRIVHDADLPMRERMLESLADFAYRYLLAMFADGRERGELRAGLDLEMAALIAVSVLERILVAHAVDHKDLGLGLHRADPAEAGRIGARAIDLMRRGMGARP